MIEATERDGVRILRMAHGKANALDLELLRELEAAVLAFEKSPARALVLTGTGPIFCAGVDLKRVVDGGAPYLREFLPALEAALLALFTCRKPTVAAIGGHAIAGGFILGAACDRRLVAAGTGRLGLPELHVGVPFPTLVVEILRHAIAPPRLQELLLVGGTHPPDTALGMGLVDEVVPGDSLLDAATATASRLGQLQPEAYATTKRSLRAPSLDAWRARGGDGDAAIVAQWCAAETLAAIGAFVEKTLKR